MRVFVCATFVAALFHFCCDSSSAVEFSRGPSTQEEREQALVYTRQLENTPFGIEAEKARNWMKYWVTQIPDLYTDVCGHLLEPINVLEKKYARTLHLQVMFSSMAYVIENLEDEEIIRYQAASQDAVSNKQKFTDVPISVYVAGLEGVAITYEAMLKKAPGIKHAKVDELVNMMNEGTLEKYVIDNVDECYK